MGELKQRSEQAHQNNRVEAAPLTLRKRLSCGGDKRESRANQDKSRSPLQASWSGVGQRGPAGTAWLLPFLDPAGDGLHLNADFTVF